MNPKEPNRNIPALAWHDPEALKYEKKISGTARAKISKISGVFSYVGVKLPKNKNLLKKFFY